MCSDFPILTELVFTKEPLHPAVNIGMQHITIMTEKEHQ
jgi:hypothetical protein